MNSHSDTKILVVEDEFIISEYLLDILHEEGFENVEVANDKETATFYIMSFLPEIILMDINLNGKNAGVELSKYKNENAAVIFITGQSDLALINEAIKTNPDGYLTKPIKKMDLLASINLLLYKKQKNSLKFKDGYDAVIIEYSDIKYINADGNYINIVTDSKKYTIRESLNAIAEKLPSELFLQTHRSYLVNKNKVQRVTSSSVFVNGLEIPLSRTYAKDFK